MKRLIPLALIAAVVATPALAEERLIEAGKAFFMLDKFYAVPAADRSHLAVGYTVLPKDGVPLSSIHMTLVVNGKRTPIPLAADGRIERIPTAAELAAHAQLALDTPKGAFSNRMDFETTIRPAQEVSAAECQAAIAQGNAAIKSAAGMMAFAAPHIKAAGFPGAGSGVAVMADGKTTPLPVVKGAPVYDPEAIKGAKTLRLAKAPVRVTLE